MGVRLTFRFSYYRLHQSWRLRPRPKQSCAVTMIDLLQTIYELWILEIF